jgi:HlyD family secretion protein
LEEAKLSVTDAETAVTQADAGISQAEAAVASAEEAIARMTLTAPFDGVVADIAAEKGEVVSSVVPVATIGDFSGWMVETTDLRELDVVDLKPGDPVELTIDAIPGEVLNGTVREISQVATYDRNDVTYKVTIDLDNPDKLPLRWGMTVFVNVNVD